MSINLFKDEQILIEKQLENLENEYNKYYKLTNTEKHLKNHENESISHENFQLEKKSIFF